MDKQAEKQWRLDESLKFATSKLTQAEMLVETAERILRTNGFTQRADDAAEALESIHGALGG